MFIAIWLLLLSYSFVDGEILPFTVCESGSPPITVSIDPCEESTYVKNIGCVFKQGTQVKVQAAFIAPFTSGNLETVATATFRGQEIPFPDSGNNACPNVVPRCPLVKGKMYILNYVFDIMKYYPTGEMDIQFSIRDRKTKKVAACARTTVIIIENRHKI